MKDCTPNTTGRLKPCQQLSNGPKCQKQHSNQAEPPGKLVSHPRYEADHQGNTTQYGSLSAMDLLLCGLKYFKQIFFQTDGFSTESESEPLSQESLR